jgi:hypothetical protein
MGGVLKTIKQSNKQTTKQPTTKQPSNQAKTDEHQ